MKQIVKGFKFHIILDTKEMKDYSLYLRNNIPFDIQHQLLEKLRLPLLEQFERIIDHFNRGETQ